MENKIEYFRRVVTNFRDSDQLISDYMALIIASVKVTQQGSGLVWSEIESVLREVL